MGREKEGKIRGKWEFWNSRAAGSAVGSRDNPKNQNQFRPCAQICHSQIFLIQASAIPKKFLILHQFFVKGKRILPNHPEILGIVGSNPVFFHHNRSQRNQHRDNQEIHGISGILSRILTFSGNGRSIKNPKITS